MTVPASRLPNRFPVGSRYVVEGRGDGDGNLRVFSRYVLLPDGRRIDIPADLVRPHRPRTHRNRRIQPVARRSAPPARQLKKVG
jgi:hypothetical protein